MTADIFPSIHKTYEREVYLSTKANYSSGRISIRRKREVHKRIIPHAEFQLGENYWGS